MMQRFLFGLLLLLFPFYSYAGPLVISELMAAKNESLADGDGDFEDWIEIQNRSDQNVSLAGWALCNKIEERHPWFFPEKELKAGECVIVFASGKDRKGDELHCDFKLDKQGEYLALTDPQGKVVSEFNPYPVQEDNASYGLRDNSWYYFDSPTPGEDNHNALLVRMPKPTFDVPHGFYDNDFLLTLSCPNPNARIYYTLDGSSPSSKHGTLYQNPLPIKQNTVIRAIAAAEGVNNSKSITSSYLFIKDILAQNNTPQGYPTEWGPYATRSGIAEADYEMDREMLSDPDVARLVEKSLRSLPIVSIVTDIKHLFGKENDAQNGGIYIYTDPPTGYTKNQVSDPGSGWIRTCSFEWIDAEKGASFQVNCGLRLHGGHSRLPEKSPKHSFRLLFKEEYGQNNLEYPLFGEDKVQKFDKLVLRGGFCNTWIHANVVERNRALYTRDTWAKEVQHQMGHVAASYSYAHLFLNGLYWGIYTPTERIDKHWCESHLGGDKNDYDVIKVEDNPKAVMAGDGNMDAWNTLLELARKAAGDSIVYEMIQGNHPDRTPNKAYEAYLDIEAFIDYMILNYYGGNTDWDSHNWLAVRNRIHPEKGFRLICWDNEHLLKSIDENILSLKTPSAPTYIFNQLISNPVFYRQFVDRVQKHCYSGLLRPDNAARLWEEQARIVEPALYAEQARWGDYRRDVHQWNSGPYTLCTVATHYEPLKSDLLRNYFPKRRDVFIQQLRDMGWFPSIDAPEFLLNGQEMVSDTIKAEDILSLTSTKGKIYYTLDGSDPVYWSHGGKAVLSGNAQLYQNAFPVTKSVCIKARSCSENTWSALSEIHLNIPLVDHIHHALHRKVFTEVAPNPIREQCTFSFDLAMPSDIDIRIYDISGRCIAVVCHENYAAGAHKIVYQADGLKAGLYFGKIQIDDQEQQTIRLVKQ